MSQVVVPSQPRCAEALRKTRWDDRPSCIECSGEVVLNGRRDDSIQQYRCRECGRSFNDRSDTFFSKTQMQLNECIYAIKMFDEGSSVNSISKELERNWETVNRFLKHYRNSLGAEKLIEEFEEQTDDGRLLEPEKDSMDYARFGCR